MNIHTKKFAFLFIFGCLFLFASAHSDSLEIHVQNVVIHAKSNVMSFKIKYSEGAINQIKHNHFHYQPESGKYENHFELMAVEFEAPNKIIKSDFEQMVRAEEFPKINIYMEDVCIPNMENKMPKQISIRLQLGGVFRKVKIDCSSSINSDSTQTFAGRGQINLFDFGLEAPKHIFGLIKVKESIIITFEVRVSSNKN